MLDNQAGAHDVSRHLLLQGPGKAIAEPPAGRLRNKREQCQLKEQDAQHLAAGEAEDAHARDLARTLEKRDACTVVDDRKGNNHHKPGIDVGHRWALAGYELDELKEGFEDVGEFFQLSTTYRWSR